MYERNARIIGKIINIITETNSIKDLKAYILENKIDIEKLTYQYKTQCKNDILIQIIEHRAHENIVEFIIIKGKYKTLNYTLNKKIPLSSALKRNNFKVASLLKEWGADINYISFDILKDILYSKNIEFMLENGLNISLDLINFLVKEKLNIALQQILKYKIFCNKFIVLLSYYSRNKISLSKKKLYDIIDEKRNSIGSLDNVYDTAFTYNNYKVIPILYEYDNRTQDDLLNCIYNKSKFFYKHQKIEFLKSIKVKHTFYPQKKEFFHILEKRMIENKKNEIFVEENQIKYENILNLIKENNVTKLQNYLIEEDISLSTPVFSRKYHKCDDILKFCIESNASIPMIQFIIQESHYKEFNYDVYLNNTLTTLLCATISNKRFDIFHILTAKKDIDINSSDILLWLYKASKLNEINLKFLLNRGINISTEFLKYLLKDNKTKFLNLIFKYFYFNNTTILTLLSMYECKTALSKQQLIIIIEREKDKVLLNKTIYEIAIEKNNYDALQFLYYRDFRENTIILKELFQLLHQNQMEQQDEIKKKIIFINKIKDNELKIPVDYYFLNNLISSESLQKIILEYIKSNAIGKLSQFIRDHNLSLDHFNHQYFDLLIYAIESDASLDMIKFILPHYITLNYTVLDRETQKYKTPLYCALFKHKFMIVKLLLKSGADKNYVIHGTDILTILFNESRLNYHDLTVMLTHGFTITSQFITTLLGHHCNHELQLIFNYYIYHDLFIVHLITLSKKRISLSSSQLKNILSNVTINYDWYYQALSFDNKYILSLLNQYSNMYPLFRFELSKIHELLYEAMENNNYKFIKNFIDHESFDCCQLNLEKFLSDQYYIDSLLNLQEVLHEQHILYDKENDMKLKMMKFFLTKILRHPSFDFKKIHFEKILKNIYELGHFSFLKYFIRKSLEHPTFNLKVVDIKSSITYLSAKPKKLTKNEEIPILYYFIQKLFACSKFDTKHINVDFILLKVIQNGDINFLKLILMKLFHHKSFSFDYINFRVLLSHLYQKKDINLIKLVLEKSFKHPTFNLVNKLNFESILFLTSHCNHVDLIKFVINKFFSHPTFDLTKINIKKSLMIIRQLNNNISILNYFLNTLLNNKEYVLKSIHIKNIFRSLHHLGNNEFMKLTIDKILKHDSFYNNNIINIAEIIDNINEINDPDVFKYFIENIFYHPSFEFTKTTIERILLATCKIHHEYPIDFIIEQIIKFNEKRISPSIFYSINFERIIRFASRQNNMYILKCIITKILKSLTITTTVYEKYILIASKNDHIPLLKLLLEELFNGSLDRLLEHSDFINDTLEQILDFALILNSFIKLGELELVKYIIKRHKPSIHFNNNYINIKDGNGEIPIITAALFTPCNSKGLKIFKFLVDSGANCNVKNINGQSLLKLSLQHKNYLILRELFKQKISFKEDLDLEHANPLIKAIYSNQINQVKSLIMDNSNDINFVNNEYSKNNFITPLTLSYFLNYHDIFDYLLEHSNLNELDCYGFNILQYAILREDYEKITILIKKGADVNFIENRQNHCGHSAIEISLYIHNKEIFLTLINCRNAIIDKFYEKDVTLLITLLQMKHWSLDDKLDLIKHLIAKGINFNIYTKKGYSLSSYIFKTNCLSIIKLFTSHGINIRNPLIMNKHQLCFNNYMNNNYTNNSYPRSILMYAIEINDVKIIEYLATFYIKHFKNKIIKEIFRKGRLDILQLLIPKFIDINRYDNEGNSFLMYAVEFGKISLVKYLFEHDISFCDDLYEEIMKKVIFNDELNILKFLIPYYSEIIKNKQCQNQLLNYAIDAENEKIVEYLMEYTETKYEVEQSRIQKVILNHDFPTLKLLIDYGVDINQKFENGGTFLSYAIENKDEDIIEYLLDCQVNTNVLFNSNKTALIFAIEKRIQNNELIKRLVDVSINFLDVSDIYGSTALTSAIESKNNSLVKYLIEKGADVYKSGKYANTPLTWAIETHNMELVKYLVKRCNDLIKSSNKWNTPFMKALHTNNHEIIKYLLKHGASVNYYDEYGKTPLLFAVEYGDEQTVKYLVNHGADLETMDEFNNTAVIKAFKKGHKSITKYLTEIETQHQYQLNTTNLTRAIVLENQILIQKCIHQGAVIDQISKDNYTPLMIAIKTGKLEIVQYLVENGANVNKQSQSNRTPLLCAITEKNLSIIKYLVNHGADVNFKRRSPNALAINIACKNGNVEIVDYLLQLGADINHQGEKDRNTPLIVAILNRKISIAKYLIEKGADLNKRNGNQETPLKLAIYSGHTELMKCLIDHGADVNQKIPTFFGRAQGPLDFAIQYGEVDILKYLLDHGAIGDPLLYNHNKFWNFNIYNGCNNITNDKYKTYYQIEEILDQYFL